jgi:hypothetical protein
VPELEEFYLNIFYPKLKNNRYLAPYLPDLKDEKFPDYTWSNNVIKYSSQIFIHIYIYIFKGGKYYFERA